jgi:hypothetical protein
MAVGDEAAAPRGCTSPWPSGSNVPAVRISDRVATVLSLAAAAYLGFYVFGLVMGIYSPGEVIGFTIAAAAMVVLLLAIGIRNRLGAKEGEGEEALREEHRIRERRGF